MPAGGDAATGQWRSRDRRSPDTVSSGTQRDGSCLWEDFELPPKVPLPYAKQIAEFVDYMRQEKGLSPHTITYRNITVQDFLTGLERHHHSLRDVSAREIDRWLTRKVHGGGYARLTVQTRASTLRSFLYYAQQKGWCREGLANTVKSARCYTGESFPLGPSWQDVRQLLSSLKDNHSSAIRDRAIILLLAVYGLRAGEVAGLRLEILTGSGSRSESGVLNSARRRSIRWLVRWVMPWFVI